MDSRIGQIIKYVKSILVCSMVATILLVKPLAAQQTVQYSMYMLNPNLYNPAYTATTEYVEAIAQVRTQWQGIEGNPRSQFLSVGMPIFKINSGINLAVENDALGIRKNTQFRLSYGYHFRINENWGIGTGIAANLWQQKIDGSLIKTPEGQYEGGSIAHLDPILEENTFSSTAPTAHAGIFLKGKSTQIGFSVLNLWSSNFKFTGNENVNFSPKKTFLFTFAKKLKINDNFALQPSFLIKTDGVGFQSEFSTLFLIKNNITTGISFRGYNNKSIDSAIALVGLSLNKNITLNYAFDLTLSTLNDFSRGSHEIILLYKNNKKLGEGRLPPVIYNTRFW